MYPASRPIWAKCEGMQAFQLTPDELNPSHSLIKSTINSVIALTEIHRPRGKGNHTRRLVINLNLDFNLDSKW